MMKQLGRSVLAGLCRIPVPGRYAAVESLSPLLMPSGPVPATLAGGLRLRCDLHDLIQRQIYYGLYEPHETRFLTSLVKPGDCVLDIGANIGYYTALLAQKVGPTGQVHAFEPVEENAAVLRDNLALNGFNHVTVNTAAVSDGSAASITLYLRGGVENSGWASVATSVRYENVPREVPAVTVDAYAGEHGLKHIDVMKLDIEGAEPMALRGAAATLAGPNAPKIVCEINTFLLERAGSSADELVGILRSSGYSVYEITGASARVPYQGTHKQDLVNVFAVKER